MKGRILHTKEKRYNQLGTFQFLEGNDLSSYYLNMETHLVCQEVPEGTSDCLGGLTFVISGTLDRYFSSHREVSVVLLIIPGVTYANSMAGVLFFWVHLITS